MNKLTIPGKINVLVGCEFSGRVREAFNLPYFNTWSCDILPSSLPGQHYQGDIFDILYQGWDVLICFPPCTFLSNAGNAFRFNPGRTLNKAKAMLFVARLWDSEVNHICIENPVGALNTFLPVKPQTIHPYFFGDSELKRTCLFLKNLPQLKYSLQDDLFMQRTSCDRPKPYKIYSSGKKAYFCEINATKSSSAKIRSTTFPGIASAMGLQWSAFLISKNPNFATTSKPLQ